MAMTTDSAMPLNNWPLELQQALASYFSLDELQDLCLRLGLDFEELGDGPKTPRVFRLIRHMVTNGRLEDLLDQCQALRPHVAVWEQIRLAARDNPDLFTQQLEEIDDDLDLIQLSGDFSGATIQINTGPFGNLFQSARSRRIALIVLITLLVLTGSGVLYSLGFFDPEPVPDQMSGDFNIAVAEFAVLDEAGHLTNAQHTGGQRIADRVAQNLRQEFAAEGGVEVWEDSPELVADHHVTIGVVADDVAGARLPVEVTEALGADVLIYGRVEPATSLARQSLRFYLAPQFGQDFTNLVGNYTFDVAIPVFDPTRPSAEVWRVLDPLSKALARMLLGLRLERIGEPERALAEFDRAAELMPDADILHYFVGQENLVLTQKTPGEAALVYEAAAEAAFNESLRLNPDNARAIIGLAGIKAIRAQRLLETGKDPAYDGDPQVMFSAAQAEAKGALATYDRVASRPEQTEIYGLPVASIARLGQGISLRILGDAAYRAGDTAAAEDAFNQAIETLESAVAPLEEARDFRLMAQLYQALGTVYEWQGFLLDQAGDPAATQTYDQALNAYNQCRQLGEEFPIDVYLTERIVAELCLPRIEALEATMGGK